MGTTVEANRELRMTWECVCIAIAGSRMGKSVTLAIPAMCYAPGFLLGTSNKPDIYTHTLYLRKQMGRVWLFDLEGVTTGNRREQATFWFNPLRRVDDLPSARVVCDYFISAATDAEARVDAYFDGAARDLFGSYVLAAALVGGDLRHVVDWLRETQSQIPVKVLAQNGYTDLANTMQSKQSVNAKQRDGFYDIARRFLAPLDEPRYEEAILPNTRITIGTDSDGRILVTPGREVHDLPELDVDQVVRSTDTVYAMSKKGAGSASALTTALVGAIGDAAQEYGAQQSGGRVPILVVMVLDEAANICKLQQLPEWYSHFGSRGIILFTILQSPSQAKAVWGANNFDAMIDACNMVLYGGNVKDKEFLSSLSDEIGDHHVQTESRSRSGGILGGGQATVSTSWQRERRSSPSTTSRHFRRSARSSPWAAANRFSSARISGATPPSLTTSRSHSPNVTTTFDGSSRRRFPSDSPTACHRKTPQVRSRASNPVPTRHRSSCPSNRLMCRQLRRHPPGAAPRSSNPSSSPKGLTDGQPRS